MASAVSMDFFASQDAARKRTARLVVFYCLAVVFIILSIYAAFAGVLAFASSGKERVQLTQVVLWNPQLFLMVAGGTLLVVLSGTIFKISQLSGGGSAVALMLGGRAVEPSTSDPAERKLLNVVEEIAIASGVPVPQVFVLDEEEGINAFAAGFSSANAVVAVTRGTLNQLNRDQLQGVIAHEFSHILNGDMRLNIRLTGVLYGILVISTIGYWVMRSTSGSRGSSRSKGGGIYLVLLGFLLFVIGYIGVFFGKLIQSAVSRQREYLADASAVQFTRNPGGLAGALKAIGGFTGGSQLQSANAGEASHFFFANGISSLLFATHPPLVDRIKKLDPQFSGDFGAAVNELQSESARASETAGFAPTYLARAKIKIAPEAIVASVGRLDAKHLTYASRLLSKIPAAVTQVIREPVGARAVIYALLLSSDQGVRQKQIKYLTANLDGSIWMNVSGLVGEIAALGAEYRMPLADIAMSALRNLAPEEYRKFRDAVDRLVDSDEQVDLFEYTLKTMIDARLAAAYDKRRISVQYYDLKPLANQCSVLLSCLAYWGSDDAGKAILAFEAGASKFPAGIKLAIGKPDECGLDALDAAMKVLKTVSMPMKKIIVNACVACVGSDGLVTVEEAELLRTIADGLDCPMPPMMATANAAA